MRIFLPILAIVFATGAATKPPALPLRSGEYVFHQRFAEQPSIPGADFRVTIKGTHIEVFNDAPPDLFPTGLIESGTLMWHSKTQQWIIASSPEDASAPEAGGCSDGPTAVDLDKRIYWTC